MNVTFHGSEQYLSGLCGAFRLSGFNIGLQDGDGLLHRAGGLHHLRQEHLSFAEQLSDGVHAGHQRSLDDVHGTGILLQGFVEIILEIVANTFDEGLGEAFLYGNVIP